jgi:transcriptional regulator with XRE-family HTH domain
MNLIGSQVRRWRTKKGWSQELLATKLQLRGWNISRDSVASLESQRRRVSDCEVMFLARVLGVGIEELFPANLSLIRVGPEFRSGHRTVLFPRRGRRG